MTSLVTELKTPPADGKCELIALDQTGDTKTIWDPSRPDEVEMARKTFDELRKKKYVAYAVKVDGEKGGVIESFDPALGKIIMTPRIIGG